MKKYSKLLVVFLIAALLLPGCKQAETVPELSSPIENPDAVFAAKRMELKTTYINEGSVCPEVTDIKFDFDSKVYDVQVRTGDFVKEGDLLFRLDESLEMRVKEAEVELTLRKKDYEVALKQHNDQIKNMKNLRTMFGNMQDWYNYNLWDINIRENQAQFDIRYENVYQDILKFEDEYLELKEQYENSVITAPCDGQIVYISVEDDDDMFFEDMTVVSIAKQDKKLLCCNLIEKKEYEAYTEVKALVNGKEYPIEYIEPDEEDIYERKLRGQKLYSYFNVEGLPDDVVFGDYALFYLTVSSGEEVLAVPSEAITKSGMQYYVKVVSGDKQGLRPVTLGFSNKNYTEIASGLSEGENVFVANNLGRYGMNYETVNLTSGNFTEDGSVYVERRSLNPEPFYNDCPGEIMELYISNFSQVYVTAGQPLYKINPKISEADKEEAKHQYEMAQTNYTNRLKNDKKTLDDQLKKIKEMKKGVERELAQLKYDKALEEYNQYKIDGQELIDKWKERVEAFEEWEKGSFIVYAEKDGFLSSFSRYSAGKEVGADEYMCDFYPLESLVFIGQDESRTARYGMKVNLEFRVDGEIMYKEGRVISAYDVRPEEVTNATYVYVQMSDDDYKEVISQAHALFEYCNAENVTTIPTELILRDTSKKGSSKEETEEDDDAPFTIGGDNLSEDETDKGVPYVWVYDANGQIVKRYIKIVRSTRAATWICDGLDASDRIVVH
ncbi:MAG: biotin/lipoyl-binding protein [Lachnospiraceae bacterium]|nr:biotin/lipoyl-binding protein [Lachnospiraceae bacterium]